MKLMPSFLRPKAQTFAPRLPAALKTPQGWDRLFSALQGFGDGDELLRRLGVRRADLAALECDSDISAALETRMDAVIGSPWRLDPSDDRVHGWIADWLPDFLSSALRAVPYGYAGTEVVFGQQGGGEVTITSIHARRLEDFQVNERGIWQVRDVSGAFRAVTDWPGKFYMTVRQPTSANPLGRALLAALWWPWQFRTSGWSQWVKFLERFGEPLILGQVHDPAAVVEAMGSMGLHNLIAVGREESLTAVTPAVAAEFSRLEECILARYQRLILGQTLTSNVGSGGGSYAAAKVHEAVRNDKRLADMRLVQHVVQDLVDTLCDLNGIPRVRFLFADGAGLETERAERDAKLLPVLQASGLALTADYFLDTYDYEATHIAPASGQSPQTPLLSARLGAAELRPGKRSVTPAQQQVEALIDAATAQATHAVPMADLRAAIAGARDADDLKERLEALLGAEDPDFADLLARCQFAAEVLGYVMSAERRA